MKPQIMMCLLEASELFGWQGQGKGYLGIKLWKSSEH
jgi:hypothetical protein